MKSLPVVNNSFKDLYHMLINSVRANLLLTGIELKVFNCLTEPKSADTMAQSLSTHPEVNIFLDHFSVL